MEKLDRPSAALHAPYEARGSRVVVSTQGIATTTAAAAILKQGGNLVDAAVAASFAISVERPHSTGLGGGGFLLYRQAATGKTVAIDFRERAPRGASRDMYLDASGNVIPGLTTDGILAVAVPGLVAGLAEIHARHGKLPWASLLEPAIELAEKGFEVYPDLANALKDRRDVLARFPASRAIFLKPGGEPYAVGERLIQLDLARSLRKIARHGKRAFYDGKLGGGIAHALLQESRRLKGLLTQADLAGYQVKWREPVVGHFKGHEILSMPPPSSGGTHLIEILQILEGDSLRALGFHSPSSIHLEASAMQLAFADRARYMGDPDFVPVPVAKLISAEYARSQRARIPANREKPSREVTPGVLPHAESTETTHFSLMDSDGNMIASTQTINGWMGSGVVVPGTGILLNNEMDDFSAKPGAANLYGAVGGTANAVQAGKTPLSSMAPTFILKNGQPVMALGAPGGTRIITCVAQTVLNSVEFEMPLFDAVASARFHHQWLPDVLTFDAPGPDAATAAKLGEMGYTLKVGENAVPCRVMAVAREGATLRAVADPRDIGTSAGF